MLNFTYAAKSIHSRNSKEQIKKQKKEDLLPKAPEKLSLWKKLQKVLMGL